MRKKSQQNTARRLTFSMEFSPRAKAVKSDIAALMKNNDRRNHRASAEFLSGRESLYRLVNIVDYLFDEVIS